MTEKSSKIWKTAGLTKDRPHMSRDQAEAERKFVEDFIASKPKEYQFIPIKRVNLRATGRVSGCKGL